MTRRRQWSILGALTATYLVGLGLLAGIVSERLRFDTVRTRIVRQLDDARLRAKASAMTLEMEVQRLPPPPSATPPTEAPTWATHLEAVDAALAQRDVTAAERAWREAYTAALRTRASRPLADVGDAALRIGEIAGQRRGYVSRARELYMAALTRARADRSAQGVLRAAESFQALGDREVVEQCLIIAEGLGVTTDNEAMGRLRATTHRAYDTSLDAVAEP